ncbi:MAG: Uma2 family endonuclease [Cyanobacteria bacterium P01_H01_bin.130]
MPITCDRLTVLPGETLIIDANWEEFNEILEELGEKRSSRIAYQNGQLHIMVPLPEHETNKCFLSNFVEALLEECDIEFCPLGSTTFKSVGTFRGVEPDSCFYIPNEAKVRGRDRLDLSIDPPPDLVIEVDITSRSYPEIYAALGVPELWQYNRQSFLIQHLDLDSQTYNAYPESQYFPGFPLTEVLPKYLQRARTEGRNATMRAFRSWVREQMGER